MSPSPSLETLPESGDRLTPREYGLILLQLATLVALVWKFQLESERHLLAALSLAATGFAIHAWLPFRYRLAAFVALSIGGLILVLGFHQGGLALAAGLVLIGTTFLPTAFRVRVALVLAIGGGLIWMRSGASDMFWPLLGSMFMFRLIVYLHAIGREREPASWMQAAAYFFLLPNAFFPLFPVVDYRTFRRSYFDGQRPEIYQAGVHWMALGVSHLLLYRLIKSEWLPSPLEVRTLPGIMLFLAANYALYLRVSGHFHLICGMLHLFGFHLPRTHDWYFLASSFTDVWRRINIYWKDFMLKIFFLPAFFRLRPLGTVPAVGLAVLWVFAWTWLAHSWQAFWLLGDFPVQGADAALWLGVGPIVAISALLDYRRSMAGRRPTDNSRVITAVFRVLKVIAVFGCVSLFWARWTNREVFRHLLATMRTSIGPGDVIAGTIVLAVVIATGVLVQLVARTDSRERRPTPGRGHAFFSRATGIERSVALHLMPMVLILLLAQPPVCQLLGREVSARIARLQTDQLATARAQAVVDSYYEQLNEQCLQAGPLLGSTTSDPSRRRAASEFEALTRAADPLLELELIPGAQGTIDGSPISINRWGMRDRPTITLQKADGTVRIALIGSSIVMGYGVRDEQVFGRLLETELNTRSLRRTGRYEVLNFGVGKYYAFHRCTLLDRKVLAFQPDVIFYFAHQEEPYYPAKQLAALAAKDVALPDACLGEILLQAGVTGEMAWGQIDSQLRGRDKEILSCLYRNFTGRCRERDILPVWIYLPIPGLPDSPPDPSAELLPLAAATGFDVLDLSDWHQGYELTRIKGKPDDQHPNAFGHRLICDALLRLLERHPGALPPAE